MNSKKWLFAIGMFLALTAYNPIIGWASEYAISTDSEAVKGVQGYLNYFGYNCGTPDGVMGDKTKESIKTYQREQGLPETGEITEELLDRLIAGIPLNTFSTRYNEAVDFWNQNKQVWDEDNLAPLLEYVNFDETQETYTPNNNLTLYLNPNLKDRKMVGNINIVSDDAKGFNVDVSMAEIFTSIYAFDIEIDTPGQAIELFNDMSEGCKSNGEYTNTSSGVTYDNYSMQGFLCYKATYDSFERSSISTNYEESNTPAGNSETIIDDKQEESISASTSEYSHEHYAIDIDNEEVLDVFNINDMSKIKDITDLVHVTSDVVSEKTGVTFDTNHMYESSKDMKYYYFNSCIGEYQGKLSFAIKNEDRSISHISFDVNEDMKPISREDMLKVLCELVGKNPFETMESSEIGNTTDNWILDDCKIEMLSYDVSDERFPGVQYISFWPE